VDEFQGQATTTVLTHLIYSCRYYRATMSSNAKNKAAMPPEARRGATGRKRVDTAKSLKPKLPRDHTVRVTPYHKIANKKLDPTGQTLSRRLNDAFYVIRQQEEFAKSIPVRPPNHPTQHACPGHDPANGLTASFRNVWAEDDVLSKSFRRRKPDIAVKQASIREYGSPPAMSDALSDKLAARQAARKHREEAVRLTFWY
jgi:hypothetical protein